MKTKATRSTLRSERKRQRVPTASPGSRKGHASTARQDATVLKRKALAVALQQDRDLYQSTDGAHHVWHAWQLARRMRVPIPEWVLTFIDGVATRGVAKRSRNANTADRYHAALTAMDVAVTAHKQRLKIRRVGKTLGVDVPISRRDRPPLSAIAEAVATKHHVSANRLLARYRSSR